MKQLKQIDPQSKNLDKQAAQKLFGFKLKAKVNCYQKQGDLVPTLDPSYRFDSAICEAIITALNHNRKTLITGLHGSGKTSHIEQVAARLNREVLRINLDGEISRTDLLGRDTIKLRGAKQVTEFEEGLLVYALRRPIILILDEYDAAKPEVMFVLQRLLEQNGKLTLLETNEVITPHPDFRLFATTNTVGTGDEFGIYHGTSYINQGQLDRWQQILKLDYMGESEEVKLLQAKFPGLKEGDVKDLVALASFLRNAFFKEELGQLYSLRTAINTLENLQLYNSMEQAFKLSFYNRLNEFEQTIASELYQRVFAKELCKI